jgi:hypothetical protein
VVWGTFLPFTSHKLIHNTIYWLRTNGKCHGNHIDATEKKAVSIFPPMFSADPGTWCRYMNINSSIYVHLKHLGYRQHKSTDI